MSASANTNKKEAHSTGSIQLGSLRRMMASFLLPSASRAAFGEQGSALHPPETFLGKRFLDFQKLLDK
jgi:hypothetical protein